MSSALEKINSVLARSGMFLVERNLSYAIAFISGIKYASNSTVLDDFKVWLVAKYFDEPQPFAWEALIRKIPECSTKDEFTNTENFLKILDEYISEQAK